MPNLSFPGPVTTRSRQKTLSLALQGGGAHGAFTWGVLDHSLEDSRLATAGISGTSAVAPPSDFLRRISMTSARAARSILKLSRRDKLAL